jgi:hypothetical protein
MTDDQIREMIHEHLGIPRNIPRIGDVNAYRFFYKAGLQEAIDVCKKVAWREDKGADWIEGGEACADAIRDKMGEK